MKGDSFVPEQLLFEATLHLQALSLECPASGKLGKIFSGPKRWFLFPEWNKYVPLFYSTNVGVSSENSVKERSQFSSQDSLSIYCVDWVSHEALRQKS